MLTSRHELKLLLYLLDRHYDFYGELHGRKKLQKLLFLVEHYDPEEGRLTRSTGFTGYKFTIWLYGPYAPEVYDDLEQLVEAGMVRERVVGADSQPRFHGILLSLYDDDGVAKVIYIYSPRRRWPRLLFSKTARRAVEDLPAHVRFRVDRILKEYGWMNGTQLEHKVCEMLRLTPEKKLKYMGKTVDEYLACEGLA